MSLGLSLKSVGDGIYTARQSYYVGYPGKIFLNMLKCLIIPLIVPSLIASIGQLDLRVSGKIGGRAVLYYMTTTFLAVTLGIILCVSIRPGIANIDEVIEEGEEAKGTAVDTLLDLISNCFPPNLVQATMQQYKTMVVDPNNEQTEDPSTGALIVPGDVNTWRMDSTWSHSTNILGLVVFSVATGIAIALSGEEGKPLLSFFKSVSHVMMRLTSWVVSLAPVGVAFLIAGEILHMKSVLAELSKLAWYLVTVTLGISIHGFVLLPLIYSLLTRSLPFKFIGKVSQCPSVR